MADMQLKMPCTRSIVMQLLKGALSTPEHEASQRIADMPAHLERGCREQHTHDILDVCCRGIGGRDLYAARCRLEYAGGEVSQRYRQHH
jgi:hypothetical protein